ncbi:MAG: hypothetical protein DHS20C03_33610 [Minwuia thermotolerans]|nr:MAG: hypothetical protein DHS20C03_33610 [Minwuia thermotolerans]
MSSETPWSVRGVEPETREAAKVAARRAGLTLGQWLNRTIRSAVAEQLGSRESADDAGQLPALANEVLLAAIQEQLDAQREALEATFQQARPAGAHVETTHLSEVQETPTELSTRLQGELDEIKLLIHDYLGLLLPVAEPVQELSRQLQDIGSLSQDVRRAADAAEKAAASVQPLERAVMRMSGGYRTEEADQAHERRGGGLGKLFGN